MGSAGDEADQQLPPPPPRPAGMVPQNIADVVGASGAAEEVEPPGKKLKQTIVPRFNQMKRPGFGTKGTKVDLICNHFKVSFKPSEPVYHYNVTIDPPTKNFVNRKVMAALHATYGQEFLKGKRYAYDGEKSLFIVGSLDLKRSEFPVLLADDPGRGRKEGNGRKYSPESASRNRPGREFTVKIAHVATVDMKTIDAVLRGERDDKVQDALRVLDIVLREHAAKRDYLLLKDSYFHPSIGLEKVGDGVVLWRGFHVSFRPTSGGLSLNFDLSTTLLIDPVPVLKFIQDHCKRPIANFGPEDWMKSRRILKGVMVEVTYSGRKHKIVGFSPESCANQKFPKRTRNPEGISTGEVEVTVLSYFETERNLKLLYPRLPALDVGRPNKAVYLPIELCTILPGQRYKRSLNTAQRQAQIDHTRQQPDVRKALIQKAMANNKYSEDDLVKEFNVNIDQNMRSVAGRVLEPPKLMFGRNFEETPRGGRWNFGGKTMKTPVEIPNWAVAYFQGRFKLDAHKIATEMKAVCSQKGMKLGDFVVVEEEMSMKNAPHHERVRKIVGEVGKHLKKFLRPDASDVEKPFVLAILPEKSPDLYIPFKRRCEVDIGIVTQCIVPPKGQVNPKYLTSVSLKINLKRGGYNSVLSIEELKMLPKISQKPTIIFGLDVSHGSPGDANSPSVAAAVATVDWPRVSRYTTSIRPQPAKTEMIEGLFESKDKGMVRELLMNFYHFEKRGIKPAQILIFRDGVSESQFDQVLEKELVAFKRACASLSADYNPTITLVVVQKRHHTRFFQAKGGNVVPGTIVDRDPCHPGSNDFYLCSHFGIIGTSRPTHYHVLYDENKFTPDELQHITNSLCYSYTRCTSAVSVVAPAYYAHLAAQHCRNFVQDNYDSGSDSSSVLMSARVEKALAALPPLKDDVMKKMFYA